MQIRKAKPEDKVAIAPLLLAAMEDIVYRFIGRESYAEAIDLLEDLVAMPNTQYSYQNCWVVTEPREEIVAVALVYDGNLLHQLRKPVAEAIQTRFGKEFLPEDETLGGEYYIDCLAVSEQARGKGIGSFLLQFLHTRYVLEEKAKLGLLVDTDNPKAKELYLRLGFTPVAQRTLAGKNLEHLQWI